MLKYKKPILLIGQGAKGSKYREYAEKYQFPILTSRLGVDLIEYDHPLYIGHPGIYGDIPAQLAIKHADLIFVAGCRLSSALVGYEPEKWGKNAQVVVVDIDGQELIKPGVKIDTPINQPCDTFFERLIEADDNKPKIAHKKWVKQCQDWKKKYPVVTKEMREEKPVNSYYFTERLSELSSADDIILVDTGSCFHVAVQAWKLKKGQRFITTGGLSSMGWWVASLGAGVLGHTLCITGDGSFQMNIQELATIKHNKLPIKTFVWNNDGYGLIRATQERFGLKFIGESPRTGVWCPDLFKIASAYGIKYYKIQKIEDLDRVIKLVLKQKGPVLCEVMIPKNQKLLRPNDSSIVQSVQKKVS